MELTSVECDRTLIVIFGVPGTGKSTAASYLSMVFDGALVVSTDIMRAFAVSHGLNHSEWLNRTSHDAWQLLGEKTEANIIQGFKFHSEAVMSFVDPLLEQLFNKHKLVILEGVHITENILKRYRGRSIRLIPIFLQIEESLHGARLEKKANYRIIAENVWKQSYSVVRTINDYFHRLSIENIIVSAPRDKQDLKLMAEQITMRVLVTNV